MNKERTTSDIAPAANGEKAQATKQGVFDWDKDPNLPKHDFEENPILEGIVTKIGYVTIKGREAYYINVQTEKGEVTVWAGRVIQEAMTEQTLLSGDTIGIKYLGVVTSERGFKYRNYDIRVVKQATRNTFVSDEV